MTGTAATFHQLVTDLRTIGVHVGRDLLVHASLRQIGPVEGGAAPISTQLGP